MSAFEASARHGGEAPAETAIGAGPPASEQPRLSRFWAPHYWPTWAFLGWLRLTAALPWRTAIAVHRRLGRALWYLMPGRRRIVLRNLEICFPELEPAARTALARRHLENVAISLAEVAIAWFGSVPPPVRVEGRQHLDAALAKRNGAILYTGHFTSLELCAQFVKPLTPRFAFMFRSRHNALLDTFQTRGRQRTAHLSFANSDSRAMLRALRDNAAVWYAPDQAYHGKGAQLLPFFGEPAMTNVATTRIARIGGAPIVPFYFRRLDDGAGYLLRFEPPLDDLPSDSAEATGRLTAVLERFVRECPEQYLWTHRKFRGRGEHLANAYARVTPTRRAAPARWRDLLATPGLIAAVALFIVAADNNPFWSTAWRATANDAHRIAILWSLFAIMFFTLTTVLSLALGSRLLKAVAVGLLLVAASCGFFMSQYGVIIDESMIRNAAETTVLEATPLLSPAYFWHVALYGVVPAVVVVFAPLGRPLWRTALLMRLGVIVVGSLTIVGSLYANYAAVSFFGHEHHTLRLLMNPGYPLFAVVRFGFAATDAPVVRVPLDAELAATTAGTRKPALVVFVVGETARADRFSLNGYARDTNRYTRAHDVVNFPRVTSCGTSTAESLPCIFSGLGRASFSHTAAASRESVFGALQRLGVEAFWRDNSTGCKDVCDEAHFEQRANWTDAELCDATGCFDELLLEDFDALLTDRSRDHFIVLHLRGSHGPAYHTDVPQWAKEFHPECNLANLRNCDREAINNSYDNTILYTDFFLSRAIETLQRRNADFDSAMLYVSDHGESLGENGLYLHGFPYSLAPREQTEVPMLFWASPSFYAARAQVDPACLRHAAEEETSHDAIFHTLLPLFGVKSRQYDESLDLFAGCRHDSLSDVASR